MRVAPAWTAKFVGMTCGADTFEAALACAQFELTWTAFSRLCARCQYSAARSAPINREMLIKVLTAFAMETS